MNWVDLHDRLLPAKHSGSCPMTEVFSAELGSRQSPDMLHTIPGPGLLFSSWSLLGIKVYALDTTNDVNVGRTHLCCIFLFAGKK